MHYTKRTIFIYTLYLQRNELTNLYKNTAEDTELRIAAYLAMMQCASEETLETVVLTMGNEMDHQGRAV